MTKIFFVEGNIGTGKSTFLSLAEKYLPNCLVILEPLDVWTKFVDENGKNILQNFYEEQKRYAYTFQTLAFLSRVERLKNLDQSAYDYIFIERSIFSDREIFAKNCFKNGLMSKLEWELYNAWFGWIEEMLKIPNHQILYLRCSPETSYKRTTSRAREEETTISFEYLKQIHERHEDWLMRREGVIVLNAEENFRDYSEKFGQLMKSVI